MSQSRVRKAPGVMEVGKTRALIVKASGDNAPYTKSKEQIQKSRSRNKIPKSIRYDLDNALVSLCDVWFEEIKPHLVRNNIKLHVNGLGVGPAGGDHSCHPVESTGCSHLDPGAASDLHQLATASYANCCSTQRTASKAPYLKQLVQPQRLRLLPLSSPQTRRFHGSTCQNNTSKKQGQRHSRRSINASPVSTRQVPRLCRINNTSAPSESPKTKLRNKQPFMSQLSRIIFEDGRVPCVKSDTTEKTQNKWSQTEPINIFLTQNSVKHSRSKINRTYSKQNNFRDDSRTVVLRAKTSRQRNATDMSLAKKRVVNKLPSKSKSRRLASQERPLIYSHNAQNCPSSEQNRHLSTPNKPFIQNKLSILQEIPNSTQNRQSPQITSKTLQTQQLPVKIMPILGQSKPVASYTKKSQAEKSIDLQNICTSFSSSQTNMTAAQITSLQSKSYKKSKVTPVSYSIKCQQKRPSRSMKRGITQKENIVPVLFDSDLIDLIGEKNDKRVRLLFRSPHRKESSSTMLNLYTSPNDKQSKSNNIKKTKPWR